MSAILIGRTSHDEQVRRLLTENAPAAEIVSVYATVPAEPAAALGLPGRLEKLVRTAAEYPVDPGTVADVRDLAEQAAGHLGRGVALFAARRTGLAEWVLLPEPAPDWAVAGTRPALRPLLAILERHPSCCVAVVDSARARICLLEDGRVREVAAVVDEALRKRNYGGWYGLAERRARARAEGLRARHYQHVAAELEHVMGDTVGALVIGGHGHDIPGVAEALPRALRGRLAGTFTAEPGTLTPAGVVEPARRVLARWVTERLERLTADVLGEAAAGDRALTGLDACVAAAGAKAAALLLVSDTDRAPGTQCRGCGALEAGGRIACSRCGEKTRPVPDILDEAVAAVTAAGGEVAVVPARLLGGAAMAARLRAPAPQIVR